MRCLVTGARGQLGYDVIRELKKRGYEDIVEVGREEMDITDFNQVRDVIISTKPDVVFHCAAYTKVDQAEEEKGAVECYLTNVRGTSNIKYACEEIGSKLIYISTDYVFDGTKNGFYIEEDEPNPINVYGKTKKIGEDIVKEYDKSFIVRISWVFGINGNNFIKTMLRLAETKKELNIVDDQIGSPTYTVDVAKLLVDMSLTEEYGIYHAANTGCCSWADFAEYIFEKKNLDVKVNKIKSDDYPQEAKRPLNSRLSKNKLTKKGFETLPHWKSGIDNILLELENEKVLKKII